MAKLFAKDSKQLFLKPQLRLPLSPSLRHRSSTSDQSLCDFRKGERHTSKRNRAPGKRKEHIQFPAPYQGFLDCRRLLGKGPGVAKTQIVAGHPFQTAALSPSHSREHHKADNAQTGKLKELFTAVICKGDLLACAGGGLRWIPSNKLHTANSRSRRSKIYTCTSSRKGGWPCVPFEK